MIVAGASAYPAKFRTASSPRSPAIVGAKLFVDMAHYAGLVAAGLHDNPVPVADFVTTTTHKTLRGPRGGHVDVQGPVCQGPRPQRVSGHPGGPADARDRGQGGLLRRSPAARLQEVRPGRSSTTPRRWPTRSLAGGVRLVSGGTDNHLMLVDVTPLGLGGKQAEEVLDRCGITVNKNMIPFDERKPMDPSGIRIGTPALTTRGMGPDEMRLDRRLDHRSAQGGGRRRNGAPHPRRSLQPVRIVPRAGGLLADSVMHVPRSVRTFPSCATSRVPLAPPVRTNVRPRHWQRQWHTGGHSQLVVRAAIIAAAAVQAAVVPSTQSTSPQENHD